MISASLVLYHNRQYDIDKVLDSVIDSSIDYLFIVDHSLNDDFKVLTKKSDKIHYLHGPNNGYGAGHNIGFRMSQEYAVSDYHIVINPDICFEHSAITSLVDFMDYSKDVGLVMPKVYYPNGEFQYLCKLLPTPFDVFIRQFAPAKFRLKNDNRYVLKNANYTNVMNIPSLSGCFMFFRSSCFQKVGGFDERFFMHFEDIDISRRIGEIATTIYFPGATIIHAHEAAHKKNKKIFFIGLQNAVKYFNKWGWLFDSRRDQVNKKALKYLV